MFYAIVILFLSTYLCGSLPTEKKSDKAFYLVHKDLFGHYRPVYYSYPHEDELSFVDTQTTWSHSWDSTKQFICDKKVTKDVLPKITHAKIHPTQSGKKIITYYEKIDEDDKSSAVLSHMYNGPLDIKEDPLRTDLLKPYALIATTQTVHDLDYLPFVGEPYLKRSLVYHPNGTKTQTTTWTHRFIVGASYAALFGTVAGVVALSYKCGVGDLFKNKSGI